MSKIYTNTLKASEFYNYKPAQLKIGVQWLVVFHYKDPKSGVFVRKRLSVPKVKSKKERKQIGLQIAMSINNKLAQGWLPVYDLDKQSYKSIKDASKLFLDITKKEIVKGIKRPDTLRGYASILKTFNTYIVEQTNISMLFEIKRFHIVNFLDYILYGRNNSTRTYNNYLRFLSTFASFCIDRAFIQQNFTTGIKAKAKQEKKRKALDADIKEHIKKIKQEDKPFFVLCMATYYCFIRRTELTKLKVKNINLKGNYIFLHGSITKNKKDSYITIPKAYVNLLAEHLEKANNNDYLFSANAFKVGKEPLKPKKISDTWRKFQKKYNFDSKFQFYSLKDTGITDLLHSGVPAIVVRDQARHYDIKITEGYASRNVKADSAILDIDFTF